MDQDSDPLHWNATQPNTFVVMTGVQSKYVYVAAPNCDAQFFNIHPFAIGVSIIMYVTLLQCVPLVVLQFCVTQVQCSFYPWV